MIFQAVIFQIATRSAERKSKERYLLARPLEF